MEIDIDCRLNSNRIAITHLIFPQLKPHRRRRNEEERWKKDPSCALLLFVSMIYWSAEWQQMLKLATNAVD